MQMMQNRRRFLTTFTAASGASLVAATSSSAQEGRLETTTIRLARNRTLCIAPQYVVEDLLRLEGFLDIRYVPTDAGRGRTKRSRAVTSISPCSSQHSRFFRSMREQILRSSVVSTLGASNCSGTKASAALQASKAGP